MYRGKKSTYSDPIQYYIQEKGLKVGDYTLAVQLPNKEVINFKDKVVIERKADLNELCCNLFDSKSKDEEGLTRFERELKRDIHFEKMMGRKINIRLIRPDENKQKEFNHAVLKQYENGLITVILEDESEKTFEKKETAWIKLDDFEN